MRAEVGDVPCTCSVMPVAPDCDSDCAICVLLTVWRTTPPVSTLPSTHPALVANEIAYGSPPGTLRARTITRYPPPGPVTVNRTACPTLRVGKWAPICSVRIADHKLPHDSEANPEAATTQP